MNHNRLEGAKLRQRLRHDPGRLKIRRANQLVLCPSRVRQGAQQVEDRTHLQFATCFGSMLHRWMDIRRVEKRNSRLRQTMRHLRRGQINLHTQHLQHVGTSGMRREGPVAVLGHLHAAGRHHNRNGSRDIEGRQAVAAGATSIEDRLARRRGHFGDMGPHRLGKTGHLVDAIPQHFDRSQKGRNLSR